MRNHYNPAYMLRGFASSRADDGDLWEYDRISKVVRPSCPRVSGRENNLYSDETEGFLTDAIEGPANPLIDKVRSLQGLGDSERQILSSYIVALWRRVPIGRERVAPQVPALAEAMKPQYLQRYHLLRQQYPEIKPGFSAEELESAFDKFTKRKGAEKIWQHSLQTFSPLVVDRLMSMSWHYLRSKTMQFVSSDCPVFMFEEGLRNNDSQLSVAISSDVALWITGEPVASTLIVDAARKRVIDFNRRTIARAVRFVYARDREPWLGRLLL